jgi:hypothetical protein
VDYLLDDEEYSALDIVKTIVLNRYGSRTLRLPYVMADYPGLGLSYLHYDFFASASEYAKRDYGQSWSLHTMCVPVGQMFNDALYHPGLLRESERTRALLERLRGEGKGILLVLIDSTFWWADSSHGLPRQYESLRLIQITLDVAQGRDNLVVLVKPKGNAFPFLKHSPYSEVLTLPRQLGKAYVLTPEDGYGATDDEAVALQFVLPYATACLCPVGSAVYESLAAGIPVFALAYSISHRTALTDRLDGSVIFHDELKLRYEIDQFLDSRKWNPPALEEILNLADPFRDGQPSSGYAQSCWRTATL